jgi:hypothetical protein
MPTHSRPTWTKREGKNQDIVSYFFRVYIRLWIWFVPSRKKKEKKVRQEIENSSGDLTLSRCCCSIRTHTTFYFFPNNPRERAPASQKYLSTLSLSRADNNNNNNNIKFNVACSTDECAAEIPDTRLSNSWEVIVYFISFYSQRTGWNGPIKSNQKIYRFRVNYFFEGILGGHPNIFVDGLKE